VEVAATADVPVRWRRAPIRRILAKGPVQAVLQDGAVCAAMAAFSSAREKNRAFRSRARIHRSAISTDCSTFALSRGLPGRAGSTAVP
jgi:hypothetical protein